jgi:hypothetical protein
MKLSDQSSTIRRTITEGGREYVLELDRTGVYVREGRRRQRVMISVRGAYESALNRANPLPQRQLGMTPRRSV